MAHDFFPHLLAPLNELKGVADSLDQPQRAFLFEGGRHGHRTHVANLVVAQPERAQVGAWGGGGGGGGTWELGNLGKGCFNKPIIFHDASFTLL